MTVALEQAQANLAKAEKDGDEDMIERYNIHLYFLLNIAKRLDGF